MLVTATSSLIARCNSLIRVMNQRHLNDTRNSAIQSTTFAVERRAIQSPGVFNPNLELKGAVVNLLSVRCHHCSAPLSVSESAKFVTCKHCGSDLAIKHTDSAVHTELLQAVAESNEKISAHLERLNVHQEIEALDREWAMQKQEFDPAKKDGPTVAKFAFLIFWTFLTVSMPGHIAPFGIAMVVLMTLQIVGGQRRRQDFLQAESCYQSRRQELQQRLEASAL